MNTFKEALGSNPVVYITRDIERATGLDLDTPGFFVVTNWSNYAQKLAGLKENVFLVKAGKVLDTWELMKLESVKRFVTENAQTLNVIVFKNAPQIERISQENNWQLLNPPAKIASEIESKISQVDFVGEEFLPKTELTTCGELKWKGEKFILQFNTSHSGEGTMLIKSEKQIKELAKKFPQREARVSEFINGLTFTNNNVITEKRILIGNINHQITGVKPFTDNPFATVGNDWTRAKEMLNKKQISQYKKIVQTVGEKMKEKGFRGLFGVDIIWDEKKDKMYLIEINARQPASVSCESIFQRNAKNPERDITTFQAHILALLGIEFKEELIKINSGAQIIQRKTQKTQEIDENWANSLEEKGLNCIRYENVRDGGELVRVQGKFDYNELK